MRFLFLAALCAPLAACAAFEQGTVIANPPQNWRTIATESDRERLREWRTAFVRAVTAAREAGHSDEIAREGALLDPDAALPGGTIPNGTYQCRVTKLGAKTKGLLDYVAYPYFSCRVQQSGKVQSFAKLTGSQRPVGLIFPNDPLRQVFLGTLVLGDENRAMQYGGDRERDVAGYVERIGPARWRLILPYPHFESLTDVMELVPEPQGER